MMRGRRNLYFGTLHLYGGRMDDQMAARLIGFIRDIGTRPVREFVRVRAIGGVLQGRAVLFPSPPELRLPTLAAHLVRSGLGFLGDEMIHLDPILHHVHGLGFPILMDGDDAYRMPRLSREAPRGRRYEDPIFQAAWRRYPVSVDELSGREADPAPLGWIAFPFFEDGAETRLEPMGGAGAVFRFTESMQNLHVWGDRALTLARGLLDAYPVSRLVVGRPDEAASIIVRSAPSVLKGVSG
jgi:hypothetical protein